MGGHTMTGRLFRASVAVAVGVMALSILLFLGVLYQYFTDRMMDNLATEAALVSQGVELQGEDYMDGLWTESRITWVAEDGTVLYDSVTDPATMENHGDREEIREAMDGLTGTARRYSTTLSQQTLYATQRLEDGSVIRVAGAQSTVWVLLLAMVQPVLIILVLALLLSALIARRLARRIIQPISDLDLEHPEACDAYDELAPLLGRLRRQQETIRSQLAALRQRQQEFTALTENMSEGFLLLDGQGHVLSHNTGALRLLNAEEPAGEVNALVLNRSEAFRRGVEELLEGRQSRQMLKINGRFCQMLANPVMEEGKTAGGVIVLLDVTESERREELRREFTANVSHELKTPLTSISGIAEIMKNGIVKGQDVPGFAADIYQEAQRLIALVEDIIRLSQLDEGAGGLEPEPVELLSLAGEVATRLGDAARQNQVALSVGGSAVEVTGLRRVLDEILYNLCENAIKYNRPGGKVIVEVSPSHEGARVTVSDTGIGIPAQDCSRVFERFYRVDKSHSRAIGGTGLGLSIVKHGVQLHGGEIRLDSREGEGTTVTLDLPARMGEHVPARMGEHVTCGE